jgi:hypothetical protein
MATTQPKDRERDFSMEDTLLIQKSETLHTHFLNYLAQFSAFDPDLNAAYAGNWLSSINECEGTETDETVMDQLQHHSEELDQAKKEGFIAASELEHYVKKAFPNKKRKAEEFGFTERKKARATQLNQYMWLIVMKKIAEDYSAELAAVGMPATLLTNLSTKTQTILEKETQQEYFKHLRIRYSSQRIEKLNKLYTFCSNVNKAAQIVFSNEPAERGLFIIY